MTPAGMDLYLIRHAECRGNELGHVVPAHSDILTSKGRQQALALREYFARSGIVSCTAFCSPATRALETLSLAIPQSAPRTEPRLLEVDAGSYSLLSSGEVEAKVPGEAIHKFLFEPFPGGESYANLFCRVGAWMEELLRGRQTGPTVVVAHGGSIGAIITLLLQKSIEDFPLFKIDHATVTHASIRTFSPRVVFFHHVNCSVS